MENVKITPAIYSAEQLGFSNEQFDPRALEIIQKLKEAGHEGYLVGGCLRDLLLGKQPKDFDIATDAKPEVVAKLFKNCRLIGRRFRLAHIYFGRHIFEVATFRAEQDAPTDENGKILKDNCYGTLEDDVIRRDFTINALYYDPLKEEVLDYLGALDDIRGGVLRLIGDAKQRYQEDPVRMLRAARFQAKLGMQLEAHTKEAISECRELLRGIPAARLFDETQKLFVTGYAKESFASLVELDLFAMLFPDVAHILHHPQEAFKHYAQEMMMIALHNTDSRINEGKPVTIAFLLAAFFWPVFQLQYKGLLQSGKFWHEAMHEAIDLVLIAGSERITIPARLRSMIREIWVMQARFDALNPKQVRKVASLLEHPRFRAAFDFLEIRAQAGEDLADSVAFWQRAQEELPTQPRKTQRSRSGNKRHYRRPRRRS